jgi:hypothetical protein
MEEQGLWEIWNKFGARLMWTAALKDTQTEAERQAVQQKLGELPDVTALDALRANAQLVDLLVGRRWYVMQAAREEGATWDEIGNALGMTRQGAHDLYQRRIATREQVIPELHDKARGRAALGGDG